jgi:hypothetical protein
MSSLAQDPTAPLDYIQFFNLLFESLHRDAVVVTDSTRSHSLFVARDTTTALHFIQQDSSQTRAVLLGNADMSDGGIDDDDLTRLDHSIHTPAAPPFHSNPSQLPAAVPDSDAETDSLLSDHNDQLDAHDQDDLKRQGPDQDTPLDGVPGSEPPFTQLLQYTVTNRNRAKERARARKKLRLTSSPVSSSRSPTPLRDPADHALPRAETPLEERSKLTLVKDHLPALTWIMSRTVAPSTVTTPAGNISYATAANMIQKAKALGNSSAVAAWQAIFKHWRVHGTLTTIDLYAQPPTSSQSLSAPSHLAQEPPEVRALYRVFQTVNQSDVDGSLHLMFHRRYYADLFQHYQDAEATLCVDPSPGDRPRGVTNAAVVKLRLFRSLYPEYKGLGPPRDKSSSRKWRDFHKKLEKGRRWLYLRQQTNAGIFALIPDSVSNSWIEKTLPYDVFCTWVHLIRNCNQPAVALGERMLTALQQALSGHAVPEKRIRLEIAEEAELKDCPDTSVLFNEVDDSSDEEEESVC